MFKESSKSLDELDRKMNPKILKQAKEDARSSEVLDKMKKESERFVSTNDSKK
ncbi:hypothetical protein ACJJIF_16810 [Microbulbifer sp. SSSA002]|uniref:hypothetical protein n=1 Tax=unclassified Microbulbifer TaxID=2619833 RepID=UPI0040399819